MMPSLLNEDLSAVARTHGMAYHRTADGLQVYLVYRDESVRLLVWRDDRAVSHEDVARVRRAIAVPADAVMDTTESEWIVWVVGPARRRCGRAAQVATNGGFTLTWPDAETLPVPIDLCRALRAWLGCARRSPSPARATQYLRYARAMLDHHRRLRWHEVLIGDDAQLIQALPESGSVPSASAHDGAAEREDG
jgi:hypothetical protein